MRFFALELLDEFELEFELELLEEFELELLLELLEEFELLLLEEFELELLDEFMLELLDEFELELPAEASGVPTATTPHAATAAAHFLLSILRPRVPGWLSGRDEF